MSKSRKLCRQLLLLALALTMAVPVAYAPKASAHSSMDDWDSVNHGFFKHNSEGGGWWNVWPSSGGASGCQGNGNALPTSIDTASEFINFVKCKLTNGSTQEKVGAAFIISTMIGAMNINPTASQISEFEARVNYAGSQGWIQSVSLSCSPSSPPRNTFYQSTRQDVAWYWGCPVNNNGVVMTTYSALVFYGGSQPYIIARLCANPIGSMLPLPDNPEFNMSGTTRVNGSTNINVQPGQSITFTHSLTNGGPTSTSPTSISWTTQGASSSSGPWSNIRNGNAGTFSNGQTKSEGALGTGGTETVTVPNQPGTQICRRITWTPDTHNGGSQSSAAACANIQYNFNLAANIELRVNGQAASSGSFVEPGDVVTFRYFVNNNGPTVSQSVTCTYRWDDHAGYSTADPTKTFTPPGASCPPSRTFNGNSSNLIATQDIVAAPNTSICRSLTISPVSASGGSNTAKRCVHVAAKPYFRVYSGDVMAGGGFMNGSSSCTLNSRAAIISWNRGSSANYAGAGVQYAAIAMHQIFEVATSNAPGGSRPSGHSFANSNSSHNSPANGRYGGHFGGVQCIPDYFGSGPATYTNLNGTSTLSGSLDGTYYKSDGNLQINGATIAPGSKATVYVDGNVFINGDITYGGSGSWDTSNIPNFRLIVKGSIFVGSNVAQLDGLYVAQPKSGDSVSGRIYTCQTSASPYVPLSLDVLASQCGNKLTVNGAFVADQVWLMRTRGTLKQAVADEGPGSSNIAEVFNLNPAFWISQPADASSSASKRYDSIISLPPIL